jgi:hypothetical protein
VQLSKKGIVDVSEMILVSTSPCAICCAPSTGACCCHSHTRCIWQRFLSPTRIRCRVNTSKLWLPLNACKMGRQLGATTIEVLVPS